MAAAKDGINEKFLTVYLLYFAPVRNHALIKNSTLVQPLLHRIPILTDDKFYYLITSIGYEERLFSQLACLPSEVLMQFVYSYIISNGSLRDSASLSLLSELLRTLFHSLNWYDNHGIEDIMRLLISKLSTAVSNVLMNNENLPAHMFLQLMQILFLVISIALDNPIEHRYKEKYSTEIESLFQSLRSNYCAIPVSTKNAAIDWTISIMNIAERLIERLGERGILTWSTTLNEEHIPCNKLKVQNLVYNVKICVRMLGFCVMQLIYKGYRFIESKNRTLKKSHFWLKRVKDFIKTAPDRKLIVFLREMGCRTDCDGEYVEHESLLDLLHNLDYESSVICIQRPSAICSSSFNLSKSLLIDYLLNWGDMAELFQSNEAAYLLLKERRFIPSHWYDQIFWEFLHSDSNIKIGLPWKMVGFVC